MLGTDLRDMKELFPSPTSTFFEYISFDPMYKVSLFVQPIEKPEGRWLWLEVHFRVDSGADKIGRREQRVPAFDAVIVVAATWHPGTNLLERRWCYQVIL